MGFDLSRLRGTEKDSETEVLSGWDDAIRSVYGNEVVAGDAGPEPENPRKQLSGFDAENKGFFDEWAGRQKELGSIGRDPLKAAEFLKYNSENRGKYEQLMQKRNELKAAVDNYQDPEEQVIGGQLAGLRESIDKGLEAAYADYDSRQNRFRKEHPFLYALSGVRGGNVADMPALKSREFGNLSAAKSLIDDSEKLIKAAGDEKEGSFGGGVVRGFRDGVFDIDTWSLGITDAMKNTSLMLAAEKAEKGEKLTEDEDRLLTAAALNMAVQQYYGSKLGRGYKSGQTTATSIPFMLEMIANPASGAGKGIAKTLAKYGLKKLGKAAGRVAGDVAASVAMTGTTGAVGTVADAVARHTGEVQYDMDGNGVQYAGQKGGEEWPSAIGKAAGARTIENFSEMMGEYFSPLGKLIAGSRPMKAFGASKIGKLIDNIGSTEWAKAVKNIEKNAQWHGVIGEYGEEVAGSILNSLTVGDSELADVFDMDQQIDTFLGVSLLGGFFSGIKTAGYLSARKKAGEKVTGLGEDVSGMVGERWDEIKEELDAGDTETVNTVVKEVLKDKDYSPEQKAAVLDYVKGRMEYEGALKADRKKEEEEDGRLQQETGGYVNSVTGNVEVAEDKDGNTVYVLGETPDGDHKMYILNKGGEKITVSREDFEEEYEVKQVASKQEFLEGLISEKESSAVGDGGYALLKDGRQCVVENTPDGLVADFLDGRRENITEDMIERPISDEEWFANQQEEVQPEAVENPAVPQPEAVMPAAQEVLPGDVQQPQRQIPLTEDGKPDYNAMSPEMFAEEFEKEFGPEDTKSELEQMAADIDVRVEKLQKKAPTDRNARAENKREILRLTKEKESVLQALERYAPKENVTEEVAGTDTEEIQAEEERLSTEQVDEQVEGRLSTEEIKPVGKGFFGDIYDQFRGKAKEAINFLMSRKEGEAIGALYHKDIGDIDLVWGNEKAGLMKIARKHPEMLEDLQGKLDAMDVVSSSDNRIILESPVDRAVVSKNVFDEKDKQWLLTAYEKKNANISGSSIDIEPEPEGKQNGTAPLQNESVSSETKVTDIPGEKQDGNNENTVQSVTHSFIDRLYENHLRFQKEELDIDEKLDQSVEIWKEAEKYFSSLSDDDLLGAQNSVFKWNPYADKFHAESINDIIDKELQRRRSVSLKTEGSQENISDTAEGEDILFRKIDNSTPEEDIEEVNRRFNEELGQQIAGTLLKGHVYQLGRPSKVLQSAGIPDLPIEMASARLLHKSNQENHPFELSEVKNLPEAVQNPIAVFRSATHIGSNVILTELKQRNKNFVVAIQTNKDKGRIQINDIRSIHPRTTSNIVNWINEGLMDYANIENLKEWLSDKIKTKDYLNSSNPAEVRKSLVSATNIIQNFENPTILEGEISAGIAQLSDELGVPVKKVQSQKELPDGIQRQMRGGRYPGLFDPKSGEVYMVMDEITDVADAQATMLHEIIGHKGIRGLFGKDLPGFCKQVMDSMNETEREKWLKRFDGDEQLAAEEYVASFAEGYSDPSAWQKVKAIVKDFFRKLGIDLKISDNDLKYILWKAKNGLKEGDGMLEVAEKIAKDRRIERELWRKEEGDSSIEEVNRRFNEELKQQIAGTLPKGHVYRLGRPGDALRSAGILDMGIEMPASRLQLKSSKDYKSDHPFDLSEVENLPQALQHPIAVFESETDPRRTVVLTELKKKSENFLAVLDVVRDNKRNEVNSIISLYPKNSSVRVGKWFDSQNQDWIGRNLLKWVDKEKALKWLSDHSSNVNAAGLSSKRIANIIQNFENPKLGDEIRFRENEDSGEVPEEVNRRFNEELERYKAGQMGKNEVFHLGGPSGIIRHFLPDLPIVMRQKIVTKGISKKHNVDIETIKNMPSGISAPIFIFQRDIKTIGILSEMRDRDGKNICVAIEMNHAYQDGNRVLEVNSVNTFHGRDAVNIVEPIIHNDTLRWVDKKKGLDWISSAQLNGQEISHQDLSSATNIIQNFENPKSGDEIRFREVAGEEEDGMQEITERIAEGRRAKSMLFKREDDKRVRLEKLRSSEPVKITGSEIPVSDDLKEYRKNAMEYGKSLRGEYETEDGQKVILNRDSLKEVLQHDYKDKEHLQSIAAIPQMIERGIYIDSVENEDPGKNNKILKYDYYVVGLNIGKEPYTVKFVLSESLDGTRYYDHKLTQIEKGELLNLMSALSSTVSEDSNSPLSGIKDKRLVSILKTNEGKSDINNRDENVLFREVSEEERGGNQEAAERISLLSGLQSQLLNERVSARLIARKLAGYARNAFGKDLVEAMGKKDFDTVVKEIERGVLESKLPEESAGLTDERERLIQEYWKNLGDREASGKTAKRIREIDQEVNRMAKEALWEPMMRIGDVVASLELKRQNERLDRLVNLKVDGMNAQGVSVAKKVDEDTKLMLHFIRDHIGEDMTGKIEELKKKRDEAENGGRKFSREDEVTLKVAEALQQFFASDNSHEVIKEYEGRIKELKGDIKELEGRIEEEKQKENPDKRLLARLRRKVKNKKQEIRYSAFTVIDDRYKLSQKMIKLNDLVEEMIYEGRSAFLDRVNEESARRAEIVREAMRDMDTRTEEEKANPIERKKTQKDKIMDFIRKYPLSPAWSFSYLVKHLSRNAMNGEGEFYDRIFKAEDGLLEASAKKWKGLQEFRAELDKKVKEIFGKKYDYLKVMEESGKMLEGVSLIVDTGTGGEYEFHPTAGQALYITMIDRMPDAAQKLRAYGISDEDVMALRNALPEEYVRFADWVQDEFLPRKRKKYNETHLRVFGASMAEINHYFPLKVQKSDVYQKADLNKPSDTGLPSGITGSIINRKPNWLIPDVRTNAFEVLLDHGKEMEHWNAYTRVVHDLNVVLSSTAFRKMLKDRDENLPERFRIAATIAVDKYQPKDDDWNKLVNTVAKGFTAAKINFRMNTALKQVFSGPAFMAYAADADYQKRLAHYFMPWMWKENWKWGMENLPIFEKRWKERKVGNEKLEDGTWIDKFTNKKAIKAGMWLNAAVDALTCVNGARAVYDYKLKQYKNLGVSEKEALRRARIDAELAFNESQQSAEGYMLSKMQRDNDVLSAGLSLFNNSNFSYLRQDLEGVDELRRDMDKEVASRKRVLVKMGVEEKVAEEAAVKEVRRMHRTAIAKIGVFGFGLQTIWNTGSKAVPYITALLILGLGGDDKEREEAREVLRGAGDEILKSLLVAPVRNLPGGSDIESMLNGFEASFGDLPMFSDLSKLLRMYKKCIENGEIDLATMYETFRMAGEGAAGIDVDVLTNLYLGIEDAVKNGGVRVEDTGLWISAPASSIRELAKRRRADETLEEYIKRIRDLNVANRLMNRTPAWLKGELTDRYRLTPYERARKETVKDIKKRLNRVTKDESLSPAEKRERREDLRKEGDRRTGELKEKYKVVH